MSQETFLLWVIVVQGFFVMYYEWAVWKMNRDRFNERKAWRLAKQKSLLKKAEGKDGGPGIQNS